ncbi:MAG: DivIVA domain-containing protein [Cyclobacteriaceae bacterium]|nr:DivIVA domain-containing protein [Cyclobacteriaceae bacterium]MDX5466793.1 DivIVA domain-containing protein [Cyclobacteriaceae bacterium]
MKISPTAIRQKAFETAFRGYEKKEVSAFLEEMSVAMEQINQENLELRSKLQQVEGEAKRLKDVEDSLFRTLKTAEDTGATIITEATEAADQIISEANQIAEEATRNAHQYAEQVKKQADENARVITSAAEVKAKETIKEIRESMQSLVRSYDGLLEQREALVKSLKRLSQDALNQIELSDAHFFRIDAKAYQRAMEELSRSSHFTVANVATLAASVPPAISHQEDEPEEQFEEDMTHAHLDDATQESVDALEHELEEMGELPEPEEEVFEEEPAMNEEDLEEEPEPVEEIREEIAAEAEPDPQIEEPNQEDPKKSSGSFFDQFD